MVSQQQVVAIVTVLLVVLLTYPELFRTLWTRSELISHPVHVGLLEEHEGLVVAFALPQALVGRLDHLLEGEKVL